MESDNFIFCLEAVDDVSSNEESAVLSHLERLAWDKGIDSIYKSIDTIEGLEESLTALLYDDDDFANYEIIYLVMPGEENNICINDYYYSLIEIAEIFEGKMRGKILHFSNAKILDLTQDEAQYFLDVTGARAISGYGFAQNGVTSTVLDKEFFTLWQDDDNVVDVVKTLYQKFYEVASALDFRLYY